MLSYRQARLTNNDIINSPTRTKLNKYLQEKKLIISHVNTDYVPKVWNQNSRLHKAEQYLSDGTQQECQSPPWSPPAQFHLEWGLALVLPNDQTLYVQPVHKWGYECVKFNTVSIVLPMDYFLVDAICFCGGEPYFNTRSHTTVLY